jgi:hypothetical protein
VKHIDVIGAVRIGITGAGSSFGRHRGIVFSHPPTIR